jgi:Xaa-Pro dipeptidase
VALHFPVEELEARCRRARGALVEQGLDALLVFSQESRYYLTGSDTSGYVFFTCAVLTADQQPITLLTRRPDVEPARRTSIIPDVRVWYDAEDANPAEELKAILAEKGLAGKRVGSELATYGLTPANYVKVQRALDGWCALTDASLVVHSLRLVKSPAELAYVRRAAELADASLLAMLEATRPGAFEGDISAAGIRAVLAGGGDLPASHAIVGSGERALFVRNITGPRHLDPVDQLTMEFGAAYRRYTACLIRTVAVGQGSDRHRAMFEVTREALAAMTEAAAPGQTLGAIDEAHRRVYDAAGLADHRMASCGYSLGATYRPTWMDVPPMLYAGNRTEAQPGMVLFLHGILIDSARGLAMTLGHTIVITDTGREVLSRIEPAYLVCR